MHGRQRLRLAWLVIAFWALLVGVGMLGLVHYETTPGPTATAAGHWPVGTQLLLDLDRPTLVMFIHPYCPCSRASIEELAHVLTQCHERLTAQVVFFESGRDATDLTRTDLWRSAAAIPGVQVSSDKGGVEAKRFGAETSGHVVLYTPNGNRRFSGGITGSRGHAGENAGRTAIVNLVNREQLEEVEFPVFGCAICKSSADGRRNRLWEQ